MVEALDSALDEVAPFAAIVTHDGACRHLGRTLRKICQIPEDNPGFFDLFTITKPFTLRGIQDLAAVCGKKVALQTTRKLDGVPIVLRASIAPLDNEGHSFLVLTSLGSELPALVEALELSEPDFSNADPAVDLLYLLKIQSTLLRDAQALTERLKLAKDKAEALALTDTLTGLPNRRALAEFASGLLANSADLPNDVYLLHVDLDRFKQVNDTLGHAVGDGMLQRVTNDLKSVTGSHDLVARIGGDEFIVILSDLPDLDAAIAVGRTLIDRISIPLSVDGHLAEVGTSIGITTMPVGCKKTVDTLLLEADLALYDVKNAGRGSVKVFSSELEDREALTQRLLRDIDRAITAREFVPYFQLQVDYVSGTVFGAEVLGRWEHPDLGIIGPQQFLYVAERAQLVERIDGTIYEQALDHLADWQRQGIAPPHISLNVTARKLMIEGFADHFQEQLAERSLAPSQIVFELVETILLDGEAGDVREAAQRLHDTGFTLAIDDFGTGRASLKSLLSVPVGIVKIDKSFVANLHESPKMVLLTEAIVNIARALDLQVLAEGTEDIAQCETLAGLGCSIFQGYLFSRPLPAREFTELLRDATWGNAFPKQPGVASPAQTAPLRKSIGG